MKIFFYRFDVNANTAEKTFFQQTEADCVPQVGTYVEFQDRWGNQKENYCVLKVVFGVRDTYEGMIANVIVA